MTCCIVFIFIIIVLIIIDRQYSNISKIQLLQDFRTNQLHHLTTIGSVVGDRWSERLFHTDRSKMTIKLNIYIFFFIHRSIEYNNNSLTIELQNGATSSFNAEIEKIPNNIQQQKSHYIIYIDTNNYYSIQTVVILLFFNS